MKSAPEITMTEGQIGYLAGIIDGEGSFTITKARSYFNVTLSVANTDLRILERCREITGLGSIRRQPDRRGKQHRPLYVWFVTARKELCALLPLLIPVLVSKKEQAEVVLEYCTRRVAGLPVSDVDRALAEKVSSLNRRRAA